jgi:hypothetical protein
MADVEVSPPNWPDALWRDNPLRTCCSSRFPSDHPAGENEEDDGQAEGDEKNLNYVPGEVVDDTVQRLSRFGQCG